MSAKIYIISGFLGSGKTTLIQKILKENFLKGKTVLVENDFGEISVDAALLRDSHIEVRELSEGCVCCTLFNDFRKALKELLERYQPDNIMIEPSGVGKLSDIIKACSDAHILPLAKIEKKITIVDTGRCKGFIDNFGEFYKDQIKNADIVVLSRIETHPEKVDDVLQLIRECNAHSMIVSRPLNEINTEEILFPNIVPIEYKSGMQHEHNHDEDCCVHDHNRSCDHDHSAEEVFDTVTIHMKRVYSQEDLKVSFADMEKRACGTILRAKGIVRSKTGYLNLQYLSGDLKIENCEAEGNMLCFIGCDLEKKELVNIFEEEV